MSSFENDAERILAHIGEGLPLSEACARASVPYETARAWVRRGRRDPGSRCGAWLARVEAAGMPKRGKHAHSVVTDSGQSSDGRVPGEVEASVQALIAGRELEGQDRLAAAQATVLARTMDELSRTKGGAAGVAIASVSRRLEQAISALELPDDDDWLTRLQGHRTARRAAVQNGKGSDDV